ncbi:hypothetical protein [Actinomadura rubrisoli]|uniref:Uncharacterized protein n=1 Tax=Actinomadura rubrisoli TaxID=2530368 RepID=A0A4R5CJW0_9ACTN|nr:hypothetical protein [Actinomadura rubrisoli]TDD97694.1 hypothetical protein E1298_01265 [Actinomadura rubrisoli]
MGRTRTPRWARRFRQRRAATRIPSGYQPGHVHGFTGEAATIPVSRTYYRSDTWDAPELRLHLTATVNYLGRIAKRSYAQASKRGDVDALAMLDAEHRPLADTVLIAPHRVRSAMDARGYDDIDHRPDLEDPHSWSSAA